VGAFAITMADLGTAEIYDQFAKHYRNYSAKKSAYILGVDELIKKKFKNKVQSVFDFGCGDGVRGAALFKDLQATLLVGGDISQEMIRRSQDLGIAKDVWDLANEDWYRRSERFDLIISLWNVFGHIPDMQSRVEALKKMAGMLNFNGRICLDVNNRHYRGYGKMKVLARRLLDWLLPDYARGDVHFDWDIDGKKYPAHGHLFTRRELFDLIQRAGLQVIDWRTVDYMSGEESKCVTGGQHFVVMGLKS